MGIEENNILYQNVIQNEYITFNTWTITLPKASYRS